VVLRLNQLARKWCLAASLLVCLHAFVSLRLPSSYALTSFGDLIQCLLLSVATLSILPVAIKSSGRTRLFWALLSFGFAMWLGAQVWWTYFEVFLRQEVPNPFTGDIILFLHIVPMMAALAVQPHLKQDGQTARFGSLDFLLLLVWWLYLYLFVVIPWQYVSPDVISYGHGFDNLYLCEHLILLAGVAMVWRQGARSWKTVYTHLFVAAAIYAAGSIAASIAIDFHLYYTGSLYDIPLVAAMAWFTGVGLVANGQVLEMQSREERNLGPGIWAARLAMLAVFSTPLMIVWAVFAMHTPPAVRVYRLLLTVGTMLVMGVLVSLKQHLQDRDLIRLLRTSHQNLEEMSRLKDDLVDKEKLLRWHSIELQRKNLELQQVSFTDVLTGLWNRRYLEETLIADAAQVTRSYLRAQGSQQGKLDYRDLTFVMIDVDFFKRINDDYGHPVGDELLQKIAERLARVMRKSDVLVRWGGEEFLVMSRSAGRPGMAVFCNRILDVMASEHFELSKGIRVRMTCSIGWAPFPWCGNAFEAICAEEVLELADSALYLAKSLGRNQSVGLVPSDIAIASPGRITLENLRGERSELVKVLRTFDSSKDDKTRPQDADLLLAVKPGLPLP
jgi:diguanylate cyclase (GGDEF)-like protein